MDRDRRPDHGETSAEIVAALAKRTADLQCLLDQLLDDPLSDRKRLRLQRRLHALGSAARSVGFVGVSQRLLDLKAVLEAGESTAQGLLELGEELEQIEDTVWIEPESRTMVAPSVAPVTVCVVGDAWIENVFHEPRHLADPLLCEGASAPPPTFEWTRIEDPIRALSELGTFVPDLFIIDTDLPGSTELVAALVDDPRVDLVPIVAVTAASEYGDTTEAAPLGVTRTFTRPIDGEVFRATCAAAVEQRRGATIRMSLPPCMPALPPAPTPLALPPAPQDESEAATGDFVADSQALEGRRVIVATDDPAVTWFLADQLRRFGCLVNEARGWMNALDHALDPVWDKAPDVVFCDAGMRGVDGLMLARALRRETWTRDVPVILLSWSEDVLETTRAAGVADACLSMGAAPEVLASTALEVIDAATLRARGSSTPPVLIPSAPCRLLPASSLASASVRQLTPPPPPVVARANELTAPMMARLDEPAGTARETSKALRTSSPFPEIPQPGLRREETLLETSVTARPPPLPALRPRVHTAAALLFGAITLGAAIRWTTGPRRLPAAATSPPPPTPSSTLPPEGLLQVSVSESAVVLIDGTERGRGPKLSVTLPVGIHELRTDAANDKIRDVEILRGRVTHVDLGSGPPLAPIR